MEQGSDLLEGHSSFCCQLPRYTAAKLVSPLCFPSEHQQFNVAFPLLEKKMLLAQTIVSIFASLFGTHILGMEGAGFIENEGVGCKVAMLMRHFVQ